MKKLGILVLLALQIAVCSCATGAPNTTLSTSASGTWEARLTGGLDEASQLNFITSFGVINFNTAAPLPLDITGFSFFNSGTCFEAAQNTSNEAGGATLSVNAADQVTGTLNYQISSRTNSSVLTLTGTLTGNSNGTVGTTGTLSDGVVAGTWQLTGGTGCTGMGDFIMCQGNNTCTAP